MLDTWQISDSVKVSRSSSDLLNLGLQIGIRQQAY